MPYQISVPFHGSTLILIDHNNEPFIPLKPIVEGMGINWSFQLTKLNQNPSLWAIAVLTVPAIDKHRPVPCIPLRRLLAWLLTLRTCWLSPTAQSNIFLYRNKCDSELWKYWSLTHQLSPAKYFIDKMN